MKIGFFLKCSVLALVGVGVWAAMQSFKPAKNPAPTGSSTLLSYDLETTAFSAPLNAADNSKLSDFEKINGMLFKHSKRHAATFNADGSFRIEITPTGTPTIGGVRSEYTGPGTLIVTPEGISAANGQKYPLSPEMLQMIANDSKRIAAYTGGNCAYRSSDIQSIVSGLLAAGATMTKNGNLTYYKLGQQETVIDLASNLYVADITRQNGSLVKETYYEYNLGAVSNGKGDDGGGCGILKRITTRTFRKSTSGVGVMDVVIQDLSNVVVTKR